MTQDNVERFRTMASSVANVPYKQWPSWSTAESLAVALILDRGDILRQLGHSMLEAVDRTDVLTVREMLDIAAGLP